MHRAQGSRRGESRYSGIMRVTHSTCRYLFVLLHFEFWGEGVNGSIVSLGYVTIKGTIRENPNATGIAISAIVRRNRRPKTY